MKKQESHVVSFASPVLADVGSRVLAVAEFVKSCNPDAEVEVGLPFRDSGLWVLLVAFRGVGVRRVRRFLKGAGLSYDLGHFDLDLE